MNKALFRRRYDRGDGFANASSGTLVPPIDSGNLVWAFDPDLSPIASESIVGPVGTATTPARTAGPPGFYTFGATDVITFGVGSLNSTWTNGTGWTLHFAINPSAGDIAAGIRILAEMGLASPGNSEWALWWILAGKPSLRVYYGGGTANFESSTVNVAITAAKHVISATWDATQAFGSRVTMYVDGVAVAQTSASSGVDGTISSLAQTLAQGSVAANTPVSVMSYIYAYNVVETPGAVAANYNWIHNVKNWF